jgi:hypothetical protein
VRSAIRQAAICVIDPTHQGYANVVGRRAAADHTAINSGSCKISSKAVIAVKQVTAPKSRFAEISEEFPSYADSWPHSFLVDNSSSKTGLD